MQNLRPTASKNWRTIPISDQWQKIVDAALTVHKDGGSRLARLVLAADDRIEELEAKLAKAVEALDEAIYMLAPDERDMEKKAGIYRIVTAYEELKGETDE